MGDGTDKDSGDDEVAFSILHESMNRLYWDKAVAKGSIPALPALPTLPTLPKTPSQMGSFVDMVLEGSTYEPLPDGVKESIWAEWAGQGLLKEDAI